LALFAENHCFGRVLVMDAAMTMCFFGALMRHIGDGKSNYIVGYITKCRISNI
jgi:hypothetical protein